MTEEVNWDQLDKRKFVVWGAGLFSVMPLFLRSMCILSRQHGMVVAISKAFEDSRCLNDVY